MTSPEGGRHEAVEEEVHWGVDCEEYVWDWVHQEHPQGEAAATVVVVLLYLYKGEKSRDESEPGPTVLSWLIDCFWGYLRLERSLFVCCCLGLSWKGSGKPGLGWSTSTYGMIFLGGLKSIYFVLSVPSLFSITTAQSPTIFSRLCRRRKQNRRWWWMGELITEEKKEIFPPFLMYCMLPRGPAREKGKEMYQRRTIGPKRDWRGGEEAILFGHSMCVYSLSAWKALYVDLMGALHMHGNGCMRSNLMYFKNHIFGLSSAARLWENTNIVRIWESRYKFIIAHCDLQISCKFRV